MKALTEIKIGIIVTIAGIIVTAILGFDGWVAQTLYTNNGQISTLTANTEDTRNTVHQVLDVLLQKTSIGYGK